MKPTIKGIFVNSHIKILQRELGKKGLKDLEKRYGKPVRFKNSENVPVRDEVRIIEHVLDLLTGDGIPQKDRAFEAGRLHFKNFATTPLARIVFSLFKKQYRLILLQAKNIAGHVFHGVEFSSEDLGPNSVKVTMKNADYPLDHFRGLFYEWMHFAGYRGTAEAMAISKTTYEYVMTWE